MNRFSAWGCGTQPSAGLGESKTLNKWKTEHSGAHRRQFYFSSARYFAIFYILNVLNDLMVFKWLINTCLHANND